MFRRAKRIFVEQLRVLLELLVFYYISATINVLKTKLYMHETLISFLFGSYQSGISSIHIHSFTFLNVNLPPKPVF